jgi:CzcA family heavy metal efflux pump
MIRSIVRASIRFRLLVVGIAIGVIAVGIVRLREAPADVLPEFTPPYVEIQTESLGLSAAEVEQFITVPLEADLLNGVEGVDVIRSKSVPGLSSIVLVFEPEFDLYTARALVQERLTQVGAAAFPNVSKPPLMMPPLSSSNRVLMIGLSSDELSEIEQSVLARWTVRPRLMGVPGVANVSVWGLRDQQFQVQVDPRRLRERDVTLSQVVETAGNAQVASPLTFLEASTPGTGGFIETPQQRLQVRNVFDEIGNTKGLGKVPVENTGGRLRLADVSKVVEDHQPLIGDALVNDRPGLMLVVEKFPGASTTAVTEGVEGALEELRPGLVGVRTDTSVFRPAAFVEKAIDNLTLILVIGGVLLALALSALLFQWRTVLVSIVAIPVSLIAAALVLDLLGQTFNAISFAGLAVAIALVIDDAVAGSENVIRHLRKRREGEGDSSTADVVREATAEIRSPLVYATLIALLPIVPVAVMAGRPGDFFEPLVVAYVLAVAAAMVVAFTLTPALSLLLFSRGMSGQRTSPLLRRVGPLYDNALSRFVRRPRTAIIAAAGCVVVGLAVLPLLGTSLIPSFKDRDVVVRLDADSGTSKPRMTRITSAVSRQLRALPGVEDVGAHVGRAVGGDQIVDVNSGEVWVGIDPDADYDGTLASIEEVVGRVPQVEHEVVTYTEQKIRDVGALQEGDNPVKSDDLAVLTGSAEPLVVRVYGQNLGVLRREARTVRQLVDEVDGVGDTRIELPPAQPNLEIEVDLEKAQRLGIKPGDVRRAEATLLQGIQVGSIFDEQKVFDVIVQGVPAVRRNVASVRNLLIDTPDGGHARLGQVAHVRVAPASALIQRDAVSRYLDVEANVSGRSLDSVANDVESELAKVQFPLEYHAEVLKETTGEEINGGRMTAFAIAALIAAFLLLQAAFRSWRLALLAFVTLPVALAGGLLAALVMDGELTLGALVGLLAVFGLAARAAAVLVRQLQDLQLRDRGSLRLPLVLRGAHERLGPVVTSAAAIAAMMLPFAIAGAEPGLEILHPMAVVILGGLVTWALSSLFVLPALYVRFGDWEPVSSEEEELMDRWAGAEPVPAAAPPAAAPAPAGGTGSDPASR